MTSSLARALARLALAACLAAVAAAECIYDLYDDWDVPDCETGQDPV